MDPRIANRLYKESALLRAAVAAGDVDTALAAAKRARRIATLSVQDIANTRDTLHVQENDKP